MFSCSVLMALQSFDCGLSRRLALLFQPQHASWLQRGCLPSAWCRSGVHVALLTELCLHGVLTCIWLRLSYRLVHIKNMSTLLEQIRVSLLVRCLCCGWFERNWLVMLAWERDSRSVKQSVRPPVELCTKTEALSGNTHSAEFNVRLASVLLLLHVSR